MIYFLIYCLLFLCSFAFAIYKSHKDVKNYLFEHECPKVFGIRTKDSFWFLLLISALAAPFILPVGLVAIFYKLFCKVYYKNRPRPVPLKHRKFLKKDTVFDNDNSSISLAAYNRKHHTNFTLAQVYGKKYVDSITLDEWNSFETAEGKFELEENLPQNLYTDYCKAFVNAYRSNKIEDFAQYLDEDVKLIRYGKGTTIGIDGFISYWQNQYNVQKDKVVDYEIQLLKFWLKPAIKQFVHHEGPLYIAFRIIDERITHVIYTTVPDAGYIGGHSLFSLPYSEDYIEEGKKEQLEPLEHHYPCMVCGRSSEQLMWYKFYTHNDTPHEYGGAISICPICGREAEFYTDTRLRCEVEPKDYDISSHFTMCGCEKLSVTIPAMRSLMCLYSHENNSLNDQAIKLEDIEEGKSLFKRAIEEEHDQFAMANLFNYLWDENDDKKEACKFLYKMSLEPYNSIYCMWNLAALYFCGEDIVDNPIKEDKKAAYELYCQILRASYVVDCSERLLSAIVEDSRMLKAHFDEINIYADKGFRYIERLNSVTATDKYGLEDKGEILHILNSLSLDKPYKLYKHTASQSGSGDSSYFIIYNSDTKKEDKDLLKHIIVRRSKMAAWEAYLLTNAYTLLPAFWHALYNMRRYIFSTADMEQIVYLKNYDWRVIGQIESLLPTVELNGDIAVVTCCYWNDWEGLVRESVSYQFHNFEGQRIKQIGQNREILYPFKSSIMF